MLAIILAGGQGTRLKPYTLVFPKALVPLGDMPVLELVLRQLKAHGFNEIILSVGHLSHLIETFFGNGEKLGINITYAREDKPLSTAGPIRAIDNLPEDFLVMNADIVSDINFRDLYETHKRLGGLATIATYRRTSKIDFGIIEFDADNRINGFTEKPILEHSVSMGVYMFNRNVRQFIPENQSFGFDELMRALVREKQPAHAYPFNGYWLDIGRVDDYEKAVNDFEIIKTDLLPDVSATTPLEG